MSNFILDIDTMSKDPNFKLFNFDYNFYTDDEELRKDFETRFFQKYRFYEIAFETSYRFKLELQARLNEKHIYYRKLYETELATLKTDFLSNKFYDETQTKEVSRTARENLNATSLETSTNNLELNSKESNLNNGVAAVDLNNGSLTKISNDKNTGTVSSDGTNTANRENIINDKEVFKIQGKGSIGVVTNDVMLKGWRSILLDINNQLLNDCRSLFLYVY